MFTCFWLSEESNPCVVNLLNFFIVGVCEVKQYNCRIIEYLCIVYLDFLNLPLSTAYEMVICHTVFFVYLFTTG